VRNNSLADNIGLSSFV